jgi:L-asparaginase II
VRTYNVDVIAMRGDYVESRHRVHAAVVEASHGLVGAARDPSYVTPWRSCAKPFQVMPLMRAGGFEVLRWGDDELALACASHGGEPEHVAIARSMLSSVGLEEGDLVCGPHEPLTKRGARLAKESGVPLTRLHNNCSGKHAAMLAYSHIAGWTRHGYEREGHPVQEAALGTVASWTGVPSERLGQAVDGCGVVVFVLSLERMATAYARLALCSARGEEIPRRVVHGMRSRPFLVGGSERFDTILIEETKGRVLAKIGAEGVHSAAILDAGIGIAVKAEDGSSRAQYPAVLRLLQALDALPDPLPARLQEFARTRVRNTRGEFVGEVRLADD